MGAGGGRGDDAETDRLQLQQQQAQHGGAAASLSPHWYHNIPGAAPSSVAPRRQLNTAAATRAGPAGVSCEGRRPGTAPRLHSAPAGGQQVVTAPPHCTAGVAPAAAWPALSG